MPNYDELEQEVIRHFKRQYISSSLEHASDEIYRLMVEHKYGKGARDPMSPVNWDKVFSENMCPECSDTISLKEKAYVCGQCGFAIPLPLYDRASEENKNQRSILEEDRLISEKMRQAGYNSHRIELLYNAAVTDATAELEDRERQEEAEAARKAAQPRRGAALSGKRMGDEKK